MDVVGAEFFGGNKQKAEFYDPVVEEAAVLETTGEIFDRFDNSDAFGDSNTARELQNLLNGQTSKFSYASTMAWESPVKTSTGSPLEELQQAREFYNDFAVNLVSSSGDSYRWEAVAVWPTFWEPSVVVTGTSKVTIVDNVITKQVDTLDVDLLKGITSQILPRFWDVYHVGMTPAAQMAPLKTVKSSFNYQLRKIPDRWIWQITTPDSGDRQDTVALPNDGFTTFIKTMGPSKENYVATSNIEISIQPRKSVIFSIPIPVQYSSWKQDEDHDNASFQFQPTKLVATTPTSLGPQEEGIAKIREKLYESVTKDGYQPRLQNGRPVFTYYQRDLKACFTENGLGMAVYDWRPGFVQPNAVGIEIESSGLSNA